jgi:hypothetical protein
MGCSSGSKTPSSTETISTFLADLDYLDEAIGNLFNQKTARSAGATGHYIFGRYMMMKREMIER